MLKFLGRVLIYWFGFLLALGIITTIGIIMTIIFGALPEPYNFIAILVTTALFLAIGFVALDNE